jgi:hypothetical protein
LHEVTQQSPLLRADKHTLQSAFGAAFVGLTLPLGGAATKAGWCAG